MKITSFNPLIVTARQAEYQEMFEALGFEKRHNKVSGVSEDINTVNLKDSNGFRVDLTNYAGMERDMTIIRMNVDDLDEAYNLLSAHGFIARDGRTDAVLFTTDGSPENGNTFGSYYIFFIRKETIYRWKTKNLTPR